MAKKVMVVDDSRTMRQQVGIVLTAAGFEVIEADDGIDGLEKVQQTADLAMVLCDVNMPRMNGLELTRAIRADARLARLPVVIESYKEGDEDRMRGLEVGADHYLSKSSFHDDQLANAVRGLIGDGR